MTAVDDAEDRKYRAPALEKGLDVLELLSAHGEPLTPSQMSATLGRSVSELFRMIQVLEFRGYIEQSSGGYRLTKSPEEYTLASILHATEGSLAAVACLEDHAPECARAGQCPTRPIWEKLDNLIEDYLGSITLADFHEPAIPCKIEK